MNRNILIIAGAAILAFLAVLLIPRLLDSSGDDTESREVASSEDDESDSGDGDSGNETASSSTAEKPSSPTVSSGRSSNPQLEAEIRMAVEQVNRSTPVRIDEFTTMTRAEALGRRVRYRYEVTRQLTRDQINTFRDFASRTNQQTICARSETRALIDMGGEIEYMYVGPNGNTLFTTPILSC